jgi:hypothetical protein
MNPTNIQEYVSIKVIEYLKERDEKLKECNKKLKQCLDGYNAFKCEQEIDGSPCIGCYKFIGDNPLHDGVICECGYYVCDECTASGMGEFFDNDYYICKNCLLEDSSKDSSMEDSSKDSSESN